MAYVTNTLRKTKSQKRKNGGWETRLDTFLLGYGWPIFQGAFAVSFEGNVPITIGDGG